MDFPFERQGGTAAQAVGPDGAWRRLVAAVFDAPVVVSGADLADRINAAPTTAHVAGIVNRSLREIVAAEPNGSPVLRDGTDASQLVVRLRPEILLSVLQSEPDARLRRELVEGAIARLSIPAAVRLTSAVAAAMERPLSPALRAVARKLARAAAGADPSAAGFADARLRAMMLDATAEWAAPKSGRDGFEPKTHRPRPRSAGRTTPEAERVVQVALESDALGVAVSIAVHELTAAGETNLLIDMLGQVQETNAAAEAIVRQIATPEGLVAALERDPPDTTAADVILRGLGLSAAKVMLEMLVESRSRTTRRFLLDRLAALGPEIRPLAEGRLKDNRWFVLRNLIALFRASASPADPVVAERLLKHEEPRVRREAVLWCLESPAMRERAMGEAIANGDAPMLRPALQAARSGLPASVVPVLARRLLHADFPPEFRVPAIQLLGKSGSLLAVEALLAWVQNGTNFLGKPRLAARTPEMMAALRALARNWPRERRVQPLLEAARASRDAEIVAASSGTGGELAA